MSLGDHLEELRLRLILALAGIAVGAIIGLILGSRIVAFIQIPYADVMGDKALTILAPTEGFTNFIKIALVTGLIVSSPWVFYHLWMFIAAGLYPNEKKYVYFAAPFCAILFIGGAVFFILVVAPISLKFFVMFNDKFLRATSQFTFPKYMSFITHLMLVFGIGFQTPVAILFLNKTGIVPLRALSKSRKYVLLVIVILSAMVTPPDVISQITLAVPLYLLFELGILLSYIANRRKTSRSNR